MTELKQVEPRARVSEPPSAADPRLDCAPLSGAALDRKEAKRLAAALKAVAEPTRLRILSLIASQRGGELCVCHLTEPLGLSQPTVSHHMRVLREAGLVERRREGTQAHYRVAGETLAALGELFG